MTSPDPIELLRHLAERAEQLPTADEPSPLQALVAAVEHLATTAATTGTNELLDHGVSLAAEHSGADGVVLFRYDGEAVRVVRRLRSVWTPRPEELPANWFPWSLGSMSPNRFLFVADCRSLPIGPGSSPLLGDIGVHSCVHLPILERSHTAGAMQLFWKDPLGAWDDAVGPALRNLGRFLLNRASDSEVALTLG